MKSIIKGKSTGFFLLLFAAVMAVAAGVYYYTWSQTTHAMNTVVILSVAVGLAVNILLWFVDSDYLIVALTALYSVSLFQLLVDSAGSFADAYQGIVMFGDPTQVGTIIVIAILFALGVLSTIVAGFVKCKKA